MIERAVALDKDSILDIDDFPSFDNNNFQDGDSKILKNNLIENEKTLILETLKRTSWNKHLAAKELGINRSSLYSKLKKHNIAMPK
jgi:transcriptional regulator of acetoin/glycerol metabolism